MRKTLSLLLALAMLLLALPAMALTESGYPVSEEPITLTMMAPQATIHGPWDEMSLFRFMEELTNVHWEFELVPQASLAEKKNLAFASGDLANVLFGMSLSATEETNYGAQGLLQPLEDLIDAHAPTLLTAFDTYEGLRKAITCDDGHIYSLFYRSGTPRGSQYCIWYNGNWLEALGIDRADLPTTLDGLYELAIRFRDEDPNGNGEADERPISTGIASFRALVMNAYGAIYNGDGFCALDDGTVVYQYTTDEYRAYLELARKFFEEGLLDQDIFTQTGEQLRANGYDNKLGVIVGSLPTTFGYVSDGHDVTRYPMAATFIGGDNTTPIKNMNNAVTRGLYAVTSSATEEQAEAAIRWVDYIYSYDGSMMMWQGAEGFGYEYVDDTRTTWHQLTPEGMGSEDFRGTQTPACGDPAPFIIWPGMLEGLTNVDELYCNAEARAHMGELKLAYPLVYNTEEESEGLAIYRTDVSTYMTETEAQFITGRLELTDATWQTYVDTINRMGAIEMTRIYTDAYARYLNK